MQEKELLNPLSKFYVPFSQILLKSLNNFLYIFSKCKFLSNSAFKISSSEGSSLCSASGPSLGSAEGSYYVCLNNSSNSFGNVQVGDTIYLNKYLSSYCDIFDICEDNFKYVFESKGKTLSQSEFYTIDETFYNLTDGTGFTGTVSYNVGDNNWIDLYSIQFTVGSNTEFNGGSGSISDPYIISNANQLLLIYDTENGYKKHYKLSQTIDLENVKLVPFFDELYKFEGSFNGNGYTIKNFSVSNSETSGTSGLFGYIGSSGSVSNLTLSNCKFSLTSNSNDALYIGAFCGKNEGEIYNCHLRDCPSNVESDDFSIYFNRETSKPNKYVYSYVGCLVGENKGNIRYCSINNISIKGYSKFEYQTNSDSKNKQDLYVGGIVGKNTSGKVESCYVGFGVIVNGYASSISTDNISSRHPYINEYVGGVVGLSNATVINVYSDIPDENIKRTTHVDNAGWLGTADKNRVEGDKDPYVASYDSEKNEEVKAKKIEDTIVETNTLTDLTYEFNCGKYSSNRTYYSDQVYEYGEKEIKLDNLWIKKGDEFLDYRVLGYYGFDTSKVSFEVKDEKRIYNDTPITVSLIIYVDQYNAITKFDLPILVQKVMPEKLIIESLPTKLTYDYNVVKDGADLDLEGAYFMTLYKDGYREALDSRFVTSNKLFIDAVPFDDLQNVNFDENGNIMPRTQKAVVVYGSLEATFDVYIKCIHNWDTEVAEAHCEHFGYTLHICKLCGAVYKNNYTEDKGPHNVVVYDADSAQAAKIVGYKGSQISTCTEKGYTGDQYCTICEKIIKKGIEIDYKNHTYNNEYCDAFSHFCIECGHPEEHFFCTEEGDREVKCECIYCHATKTYNANSRSAIENLPRITISDAYVLNNQQKVVVFVELHGNTGITSVDISVRYPNGFVLDNFSLGDILSAFKVSEFQEYADHLNVLSGSENVDTRERGTLLKLVFTLPEGMQVGDEYTISVAANKMTAENEDNTIEFLTFDGTISVVEHLPGDVSGDGVVDLLDAVLIAKYKVTDDKDKETFVKTLKESYPNFDISYGDVSLDTLKDGTDIVKILKYIVGGYDVQLWANQFKVLLDYSDFETPQGSIIVSYDNGTGTYGDALIEVERDGYKFDGWYTDRNYTTKVSEDSLVSVNRDQIKQTLYAHYTLNKIVFNGNTNTNQNEKQDITYNDYTQYSISDDYVILDNDQFDKVSVILFNHGGDKNRQEEIIKRHTFLGWATSADGDVDALVAKVSKMNSDGYIISVDLKNSGYDGVGTITLYAVWSVEEIKDYAADANRGYSFSAWDEFQ